jgi:hypothetical protein
VLAECYHVSALEAGVQSGIRGRGPCKGQSCELVRCFKSEGELEVPWVVLWR